MLFYVIGNVCEACIRLMEEEHAQTNWIFFFLHGDRHVDHLVYREYGCACHFDRGVAADRIRAILLRIKGTKKEAEIDQLLFLMFFFSCS